MLPLDKIPKIFVDDDISQKQELTPQSIISNQSPHLSIKNDNASSGSLARNNRTRNNSSTSRNQTQIEQNAFLWNSISIIENPNQPGKFITIDRKSCITKIDDNNIGIPVIYCLDSIGCKFFILEFLISSY